MDGIGAVRAMKPGFKTAGRWRAALLLPLALAMVASFWLFTGLWALGSYFWAERFAWQVSSGLLQVTFSLMQFRVAWHALSRPKFDQSLQWALVRSLLVGAVACYGMSLGVGPTPSAAHLFRAALAGWYTLTVLTIFEPASPMAWLNRFSQKRWVHFGQQAFVAAAALAVCSELALRGLEELSDGELASSRPLSELKLPAGSTWRGETVNKQGYLGKDIIPAAPKAGRFRVAALGHEVTLAGTSTRSSLSLLEENLPSIDVYNFGAPGVTTRDLAIQYRKDVAGFHPDLVLVFLSTARDLTALPPSKAGSYDWRNVRLLRCAARGMKWTSTTQGFVFDQGPLEHESYLSWDARWLDGCRTPQNTQSIGQWQTSAAYLDRLIRRCQESNVQVALVLVPADFQVSSSLREKLARRAGLEPHQIDPELPQRRVTQFAAERRVALLDLLPVYRASEQPVYSANRSELNDHGIELTVTELGRWLQARYAAALASHHITATVQPVSP